MSSSPDKSDQPRAVLHQLAIVGRERRGSVAVDVQFADHLALHANGHDDLRLGFDGTGQVTRIAADIVDHDGTAEVDSGSADALIQRNARVRRHRADIRSEHQHRTLADRPSRSCRSRPNRSAAASL